MEQEGVIKYQLAFNRCKIQIDEHNIHQLNHSRQLMLAYHLIGQDDARYDGFGFGNISLRCTRESEAFWISGTQTGHLRALSVKDICLVTHSFSELNTIVARGQVKPSSESMTHGVIYQLNPSIDAIIHIHSPDIWKNMKTLSLPSTPKDIPYGTPEMASSVTMLLKSIKDSEWPLIFCMEGHEDGVVAAGNSLNQCAQALLSLLERVKANS